MMIEMKEQALMILNYTWPILIIAIIIASSLRIAYLINQKEKFVLHKELFSLAFIIYVLCLFQAVTFQDVTWSGSNFIPFKEILRYELGSKLFIKNILGNVLLFFPLGIFIKRYIKIKDIKYVILISFMISLSIEITQSIIGRVFDVDDILLNVIGASLGYILFEIMEKLSEKITFLKNDKFLNIISILAVGGLIWFLIP